jgi:phage terminase large subunit-like protein
MCRACKVERFYSRILYPPLGLTLMGWQSKALRELVGTVRPENGLRLYHRGYISTGKQNGKSFLSGGLPIYHILMDDEEYPEAYGAAAAKEQAGIVFKAAAILVNANVDLRDRLKIIPSMKRIVRRDGGGLYQVLSADGDVQDGIRPSLLIRDEMHRWKTSKAQTLYDVTTKGQISRTEPLDLAITTAGAEYESPLWYGEYEFAKRVLDGSIKSETFYALIFEANRKRLEAEPEYWKSREARVAANPSHEDHGGFLKDASLVRELEKAIAQPADKSKYLRYHLNVPIQTQEDPVVDMAKWQLCGGDVDLRKWTEWAGYDVDRLVEKWNLKGKPCWAGVDASWTTDMTAVVFVFPPEEEAGPWTLLPFFWMPKSRVPEIERVCRMPFSDWIERGFVAATPGNAIDMRAIEDRLKWGDGVFDLQEIDYDRCNFRSEAMDLADQGLPTMEVTQSFMHLSAPTKFFLRCIPDLQFRHGNHPVLNWMAGCLQLQYDHKDNCQPVKPERLKSTKRIDGIAAIVNALSRAVTNESSRSLFSAYTGLRSVG